MPYITKPNLESFLTQCAHEGRTYQSIATELDCSKERVRQLFKKYKLPVPQDVRRKKKAEEAVIAGTAKWGEAYNNTELRKQDIFKQMRLKFTGVKARAKSQRIPFDICFGELVFPDVCPVLGIPINYFNTNRADDSPSFDRIDPTKGYIKGNVVIVSWRANRIKNDGTAEEHQKIAHWLTNSVVFSTQEL